MNVVKLESLVREKRATPRHVVVNKIAERTTLTSPHSTDETTTIPRGLHKTSQWTLLFQVVNVRIFPRGNGLAQRAFPRDYLYFKIIEDRINKAQFKKRASYICYSRRGKKERRVARAESKNEIQILASTRLKPTKYKTRVPGNSSFTDV